MIYYLENGKVKEWGSHQQLMDLDGDYAKMFNIQAKQYFAGRAADESKL